ncbi:hypothetical protein GGR54DRAFT_599025 [Hypoxylon sp. NC1633]|nr:hypothetical protein GGR54DRAFT_599025 [Hypoxylon sp. NC1633]
MSMPFGSFKILVSLFVISLAFLVPLIRRRPHSQQDGDHFVQVFINDRDPVAKPNLPRDDDAMDAARCAALHNKLVEHAWIAEGLALEELDRRSYFQHHGDAANEIRGRLNPAVTSFLESIIVHEKLPTFFYWVEGIAPPDMMFPDEEMFSEDERDRFLLLYTTNIAIVGHSMGLIYDQKLHRATMALGMEDIDFTHPVTEHEDLWHPLETVLGNWLQMGEIGKITASPIEAPNAKHGPWTWHSYGPAQVDSTLAAFERLTIAIEDRMSPGKLLHASNGPLLENSDLDAASVPQRCFIRSFLTRARRPRFKTIAPGLEVPLDPGVFVANQRFTAVDTRSEYGILIPPVLIFASAERRTVNFDPPGPYVSLNPFCKVYANSVPRGDYSTLAGLYSESVDRSFLDNSEEGFRLLLPFRFRAHGGEYGARKSNGQLVERHSVADLFQHGHKPFGGEWWRAQRLERLFDRWRELVESGVWRVGSQGVEGTIDTFKDADTGRWRDYIIEPTW